MTTAPLGRIAAVILLATAALLAAPFDTAGAQTVAGTLSPAQPAFSESGIASAVFMAGPLNELESAARRAGASGVWVQDADGAFALLVVGGPTFINEGFRARFPYGFFAPIAVTLTRAVISAPGIVETPSGPSTLAACPAGSRPTNAARSVVQVADGLTAGSAFYIGNGEWLTEERVVSGLVRVNLKSDVATVAATVAGVDKVRGVAILRSPAVALDALPVGQPSQADGGIEVWSIGFPLSLAGAPTLSRGTLSRLTVFRDLEYVQTDASVNSGSNGGPLTTGCGEVVGLMVVRVPAVSGVGFALSGAALMAGMADARGVGALPQPPTEPRGTEVTTAFAPLVVRLATFEARIRSIGGIARQTGAYPTYAPDLLDIKAGLVTLTGEIDAFSNPAAYAPVCASMVRSARTAAAALAEYTELTALDWIEYPQSSRLAERTSAQTRWSSARSQLDSDRWACPGQ